MSLRMTLGCLVILVTMIGCADLQEVKIDVRNRYLARQAWVDLQETTEGCMNYEADFGRGFRTGYFDVASGGDGCPPVLPPQRYWTVRYMSLAGRQRTEAWFQGYRYGAMVAQQDGVGLFMKLPTSLSGPLEYKVKLTPPAEEPAAPEVEVPTEATPPTEEPAPETTPMPSESDAGTLTEPDPVAPGIPPANPPIAPVVPSEP